MEQPNKRRRRVDTGVYDAAFSYVGKSKFLWYRYTSG